MSTVNQFWLHTGNPPQKNKQLYYLDLVVKPVLKNHQTMLLYIIVIILQERQKYCICYYVYVYIYYLGSRTYRCVAYKLNNC